jgi:hypothetical protein
LAPADPAPFSAEAPLAVPVSPPLSAPPPRAERDRVLIDLLAMAPADPLAEPVTL